MQEPFLPFIGVMALFFNLVDVTFFLIETDKLLKLRKRVILNEVKNLKPQIRAIFRCFASLNMTKSQFCVTSVNYKKTEGLLGMKFIYCIVLFSLIFSSFSFAQTRHDVFVPVGNNDSLDATYFVPSSAPPASGYPVLLYVHGFGGSKNSTIPSVEGYAKSSYLTLCYTVRGHGYSSGNSTIMSTRERLDLTEVVNFVRSLPNVDTNSIGIIGGSQGGLHGLWAIVDNLPVKAVSADVIVPRWASDMFANGAVRRTVAVLLKTATVRYDPIRDTLWNLLSRDSFDSIYSIFTPPRDVDTTVLQSSQKPLMTFIKYQDYYFEASDGIANIVSYPGLKKMYLGTGGHFSDDNYDQWQYQFSWITRWFKHFLRNINTGFFDEPKYTYAYSSLPMDSLGYFKWKQHEINELPFQNIVPHRFYLHSGGSLKYSLPASANDVAELINDYRDTTYNLNRAWSEGFKGLWFDSAFIKRTVTFETTPLNTSALMFGSPRINFYLKSSSEKFPINVQIYEVDSLDNKYFVNRINYVSRGNQINQIFPVDVRGFFHSHEFQANNRIRIEITNIDKTNRKLLGSLPYVLPVFKYSRNEIFLNENYASYIELPLLTNEYVLKVSEQTPSTFYLSQNYPNPFNSTTAFEYSLPQNAHVTLKVYDILGREVRTLFEGKQFAGTYKATFNADQLASGVYFYRLITAVNDNNVNNLSGYTRKMILIK
ncbi:MAG: alpha/beta fold hydrolase [Bacteroidota bacterium]|nr:alpha/beta fold hydrolase [Bacteroidota bacterium]